MSGTYVRAKHGYVGRKGDELSFAKGARLELVGVGLEMGWLKCRDDAGSQGLVPHNYVMPIDEASAVADAARGDDASKAKRGVNVVATDNAAVTKVKPRGSKKMLHRRTLSDRFVSSS